MSVVFSNVGFDELRLLAFGCMLTEEFGEKVDDTLPLDSVEGIVDDDELLVDIVDPIVGIVVGVNRLLNVVDFSSG
jgi:hypothetical protein